MKARLTLWLLLWILMICVSIVCNLSYIFSAVPEKYVFIGMIPMTLSSAIINTKALYRKEKITESIPAAHKNSLKIALLFVGISWLITMCICIVMFIK